MVHVWASVIQYINSKSGPSDIERMVGKTMESHIKIISGNLVIWEPLCIMQERYSQTHPELFAVFHMRKA